MAEPIIFTITEAGKQAALNANADSAQLKINLTQVAVGTAPHLPTGLEVALTSEVKRGSIVSGDIEVNSNTLRFTTSMSGDTKTDVYEVGLFTDDGVLFALAGSNTTPLFSLHPDITFVISFGLSLQDVATDSVTVINDPGGALSIVLMEQHLAAPDPHPQYMNANRFVQFLNLAYPFGYPYWTHSPSNPKPLFDEFFGFETHWRRLEGVSLVAVRDGDNFIGQPMLVLGQEGTTELAAEGIRPHTYPIRTSYLFERYNPDDAIETVWRVQSNKTTITEGDAVQFIVTANNVPDGQILEWTVKEGELSIDNNDINTPDKSESGTVILKNGQAIINFVTTADDNAEEPKKHVRLTVGAPADLSINVPISDLGHNETAVHITQSTVSGIQLDEYYKQQSGSYPTATDKIRFIVDAGVDIIASDALTPAITDGVNWPTGSQIVVENHGRILGRGGDAGLAATFYYVSSAYELASLVTTEAEQGGVGGTAIKGNIAVENYAFIAGGGGGGGGGGYFRFSSHGQGSSGGGGGGAPLGRRYPNPKSYEEYVGHYPTTAKYALPSLSNPTSGVTYDFYNELAIKAPNDTTDSYIRGMIVNADGSSSSDIIRIDGFRHFATDGFSKFYIPYYLDSSKTTYKQWAWGGLEVDQGWVDIGLKQSTDATIEQKGVGGLGLYTGDGGLTGTKELSELAGFDITKNKGGDGGAIGESGEASFLGLFYTLMDRDNVYGTQRIVSQSELELFVAPKDGGLAGYVKEGGVTITNYATGTTKGR